MRTKKSADKIIKWIVDYLFLPAKLDHRKLFSRPLLFFIILMAITFAILSLPVIQKVVWEKVVIKSDRALIIQNKAVTKAWFDSFSFILDLSVAILIGGSIFGERLAKSFKESVKKFEEARELLLGETAEHLSEDLEETIKISITKIQQIRSEKAIDMLRQLPMLFKEIRKIYNIAFNEVPNFYKGYMRFIFYSSFPGGLYGLSAFLLFFLSSGFKLASMYLGGPYLIK